MDRMIRRVESMATAEAVLAILDGMDDFSGYDVQLEAYQNGLEQGFAAVYMARDRGKFLQSIAFTGQTDGQDIVVYHGDYAERHLSAKADRAIFGKDAVQAAATHIADLIRGHALQRKD